MACFRVVHRLRSRAHECYIYFSVYSIYDYDYIKHIAHSFITHYYYVSVVGVDWFVVRLHIGRVLGARGDNKRATSNASASLVFGRIV